MNKSILVIDTPKNCITCQYRFGKWNEEVGTFHICSICDERLREEDFGENRADFCPLKPLPQKRELEESGNSLIDDCKEYYTDGWNDCLDEISGDQNERI